MIKLCVRCGHEFEAKSTAKYCVPCRYEIHKERMRIRYYTTERHLQVERVRRCAVCGKEFEGHHKTKYCTDCREDAYKKKSYERKRRYNEAHRDEKRVQKPADPQKRRLARLRRNFTQSQTPETRKKYFHQYVLLRQELNHGKE